MYYYATRRWRVNESCGHVLACVRHDFRSPCFAAGTLKIAWWVALQLYIAKPNVFPMLDRSDNVLPNLTW